MAVQINGTTGITTPKLDALDLELGSKNVVERGSNANGEYVRFADGTQICTGTITSSTTWNTPGLGFRYSNPTSATLPATFAAVPTTWVQPSDTAISARSSWVTFVGANTSTISDVYLAATQGSTETTAVTMKYTAIGRWY